MARSLSAQKRIRQNLKRRLRNKKLKSFVKSRIKKVRTLAVNYKPASDLTASPEGGPDRQAEKDAPDQKGLPDRQTGLPKFQAELSNACKALDKAVSSGVIHKNKAARLKSRLTLAFNKISTK